MELKLLAQDMDFENPKLIRLEQTLLEQFKKPSKCIIFSKTRQATRCLLEWVLENTKLMNAGIKAAILVGAGPGDTHMTQVLYHMEIVAVILVIYTLDSITLPRK